MGVVGLYWIAIMGRGTKKSKNYSIRSLNFIKIGLFNLFWLDLSVTRSIHVLPGRWRDEWETFPVLVI